MGNIMSDMRDLEMCNSAVEAEPDYFITEEEMCNSVVSKIPWLFSCIPDKYMSQEMCNNAVSETPWMLEYIPDQYKTQEMCNNAVSETPWLLEYIPDYFVTKEMLKMEDYKDFHESYYKRKKLKKDIYDELVSIAWHPDRYREWCLTEDEKKRCIYT